MPKDIFYFSKADRTATIILLAIIIISTVLRYPSTNAQKHTTVPAQTTEAEPPEADSKVVRYTKKRRPDAPVDLNSVDSTSLVKLPGIGPWFAMRIVEYRDRLGGYSSVKQLSEIERLPDSVLQWFVVTDTVPIRKVPVNSSTLSELRSHPYINFYQARVIVELRRQHGPIKGPGRLSLLEEFSSQDLERLEPYLDFD
ncbi:MAG: helix-hairpin-helix domain-containing protein [Bacteroidaceae bacterium]|nr:helix-hairpin-helix domain-containing protein [Bacteroidaceae bacterium]